ncbi:metal ABC transporter substrate-binding protein [Nocardioides sp.]|uniref:metal ABC transporter substrate-binding protein n=1 Tax=Nocardioides sp. TaxID=35761 RepID=UPI00351706F2
MLRTAVLATTAALVLTASGCSAFSDEGGQATASDGVQVAAAFYPLQFVAQRVAGDDAEVIGLSAPGKEPHDLEPTVAETATIASADLVIHEHGFQPAIDAAVEENAGGTVLDAAEVVDLVPFSDEDHAEEGHSEEGHSEEEHEHGDLDPHFWLDPLRMATLADAVAADLAEIDPDHAADYTARAADLRAELEDLDQRFTTGLADCARRTIVVSHDAFGYLDKYGLEIAPIAGLSPDAEPTPADLADLQKLIASDGITTVFGERLASPALTETLASDAGVTTAVLDPIEGLTDETSDDDYLSLMDANLTALQEANGCQA